GCGVEGGERRGARLAEEDGARASKVRDHVRVVCALASFVKRRSVFSREPGSLEDVLGAERNSVQRTGKRRLLRNDFHPGADVHLAECDAAHAFDEKVCGSLLARVDGANESLKQRCPWTTGYISQSSLKKPASTILPEKRRSGGIVVSTMA